MMLTDRSTRSGGMTHEHVCSACERMERESYILFAPVSRNIILMRGVISDFKDSKVGRNYFMY